MTNLDINKTSPGTVLTEKVEFDKEFNRVTRFHWGPLSDLQKVIETPLPVAILWDTRDGNARVHLKGNKWEDLDILIEDETDLEAFIDEEFSYAYKVFKMSARLLEGGLDVKEILFRTKFLPDQGFPDQKLWRICLEEHSACLFAECLQDALDGFVDEVLEEENYPWAEPWDCPDTLGDAEETLSERFPEEPKFSESGYSSIQTWLWEEPSSDYANEFAQEVEREFDTSGNYCRLIPNNWTWGEY